ncbi:MAG: DUF1501 domain-containing protein [Gammaproteobacteria bacterium]
MKNNKPVRSSPRRLSRRASLKTMAGLVAGAAYPLGNHSWLMQDAHAASSALKDDEKILVVLELSGGNDGLNTIVPYADDAYYRHRPTIAISKDKVIKLDDHYGLSPGMTGFERLWKDGDLAVIHGCGYDQPSFSHFTSMNYWHTAAPNSGDEFGWVGRTADAMAPQSTPNLLVNIDAGQSLAVKSRVHNPVVFDDPTRFQRNALFEQRRLIDGAGNRLIKNKSLDYLNSVAESARDASLLVRQAWQRYDSNIDYGVFPVDLNKVAACIEARMPTRIYYVAFRNNAFDTHVQQPALHQRLLTYAADAVHAFIRDLERIGVADRVSLMAFSEFGRRVPENANLGTDHGTANVMFMAGKPVKGGHYGQAPSLTELDAGDNLIHTTDFRRSYATAINGWLGINQSNKILKGDFAPFPVFT